MIKYILAFLLLLEATSPQLLQGMEYALPYPYVTAVPADSWNKELHEQVYDMAVFSSEGMYCACLSSRGDCAYFFTGEDGERVTENYKLAYPFHEGLACVLLDGKYGYIDREGNESIPFVYDRAAPFMEGLAYFAKGERYGFMDRSGDVAFYLDCDSVSSFQEGRAFFSVDGKYGYIDKSGNTVIEPNYDDAGYFSAGLAEVGIDGRHGLIDRDGTEVIAPVYDRVEWTADFIITETDGETECFWRRDGFRGGARKKDADDVSFILLQNEITPRAGGFARFVQSGTLREEYGTASMEDLRGYRKTFKLYDIDHSGEPVLYFYAEPYQRLMSFPQSYSGFFAQRDGEVYPLVEGYECGGSLRGDFAVLYRDRESGRLLAGNHGAWGGMGHGVALYTAEICKREDVPDENIQFWRMIDGDTTEYEIDGLSKSEEEYKKEWGQYKRVFIIPVGEEM